MNPVKHKWDTWSKELALLVVMYLVFSNAELETETHYRYLLCTAHSRSLPLLL